MKANITNKDIGKALGIDHTTVSRYRSGERVPSLEIMLQIATDYNWDLAIQAVSKKAGLWHEGFEAALVIAHGEVEDGTAEEAPA